MKIKRGKKITPMISVAAMGDISFLLLIFLIVTSAINFQKTKPIELPSAEDLSLVEEAHKCYVWIDHDGSLTSDNEDMSDKNSLLAHIQERRMLEPDLIILLHADESMPYFYIAEILDILKDAGIRKVVFVAKRKQS